MNFQKLALRTKILFGSISPLVLVTILSIVTFFSIKSLQKTGELVDHTHVVIEEAMKIEVARKETAIDSERGSEFEESDDLDLATVDLGRDLAGLVEQERDGSVFRSRRTIEEHAIG